MNKKGESGIGTLIIFIAMILVAAVAAGVLIQVSSNLRSQSLDVGRKTQGEVATGLSIIQIIGYEQGAHQYQNMSILVKVSAGSTGIKFNDTLLTFNLNDQSADYLWNGTNSSFPVGSTTYHTDYLINGSENRDGYLVHGDVVEVRIRSPRVITETESASLNWILRSGATSSVYYTSPETIGSARIQLYP